jgi:phosphonate transport system permease protein
MAASQPVRRTLDRPERPSTLRRDLILVAVGAVFLWALIDVGIKWDRLLELPESLIDFFGRMFLPPNWEYFPIAWEGMLVSIQMAWFGTVIGAMLSLPMGFLAARNVSGGRISAVARLVLDAIRAVPELVLAIIVFIPIAGLGPVAGALAIGIHSIGTLGKLSAEAIESIDEGPVEASKAAGAGNLQIQRWGVIPQVLPEIVAFWLYRFEINLRAGVVLGIVGAGGVGAALLNTLSYRRWDKAGMVIIVIVIATILIDQASGWVRRRIIEGSDGSSDTPEEALAALYHTAEAKVDTSGGGRIG